MLSFCLQTVTVEVCDDEKAVKQCSVGGSQSPTTIVTCKMLDCDTISQAKAKALDAVYANTPFSCRPSVDAVELCESHQCYSIQIVVVYNNLLVTLVTLVTQKIVVDRPL